MLVHIFHEGEVEKSEGRQQVLHIVTGKHAGVKAVGAAVAAKTEDKKEFVEGSHLDRLHDFETERAAKVECSPEQWRNVGFQFDAFFFAAPSLRRFTVRVPGGRCVCVFSVRHFLKP